MINRMYKKVLNELMEEHANQSKFDEILQFISEDENLTSDQKYNLEKKSNIYWSTQTNV